MDTLKINQHQTLTSKHAKPNFKCVKIRRIGFSAVLGKIKSGANFAWPSAGKIWPQSSAGRQLKELVSILFGQTPKKCRPEIKYCPGQVVLPMGSMKSAKPARKKIKKSIKKSIKKHKKGAGNGLSTTRSTPCRQQRCACRLSTDSSDYYDVALQHPSNFI